MMMMMIYIDVNIGQAEKQKILNLLITFCMYGGTSTSSADDSY